MKAGGTHNCLPLFEWEVEKLKELAEEKNISLNIKPVDLVLDKRTNRAICMQFWLEAPCPFLIDNKCSIYEDRPLICKAYPMVDCPYFTGKVMDINVADCNAFTIDEQKLALQGTTEHITSENSIKIPRQKLAKRYQNFFGEECFINSFLIGQIKEYTGQIMEKLITDKTIKLRKISKFDYSKHNPTPFLEFLQLKGLMDEAGKLHLIKELTDYNKVKEKL